MHPRAAALRAEERPRYLEQPVPVVFPERAEVPDIRDPETESLILIRAGAREAAEARIAALEAELRRRG